MTAPRAGLIRRWTALAVALGCATVAHARPVPPDPAPSARRASATVGAPVVAAAPAAVPLNSLADVPRLDATPVAAPRADGRRPLAPLVAGALEVAPLADAALAASPLADTRHALAPVAVDAPEAAPRADAPTAEAVPTTAPLPDAPPAGAPAPAEPSTDGRDAVPPGRGASAAPSTASPTAGDAAPHAAAAPPLATTPLSAWWLPLVLPVNVLVPGAGQLMRGDTAAGRRMLRLAGGLLAGALAGGVFLGATGASDVAAAVGVPLVVVGLGGFFSLGLIDAVSTFTDAREAFPEGVRRDAWNARWRGGLSLQAPFGSVTADRPALGAFAQARRDRWLVAAEGGGLPGVDEWWVQGGGGVRVVRYGELSEAAGLWLETSVRHDASGHLGFDATRWRVSVVSALPLGVFSERFGRLTSILRLGLDPTWVRFRATGTTNVELPLSGGFEVRWAMVDWLRAYFGYEHARDGLVGGNYLGFLGVIYGGLELQLPAHLVLDVRAQAGNPAALFTTLEWRL